MEDLVILHEDNHIIVVLKPQNMPSCEDESKDKDLLTAVKEYIKVTYNKPGNVYVGLVHRLDRPTGGVMVFAKTSKGAGRLSEQLKDKTLKKQYICVVNGKPQIAENRLTTYLKKDEKTNTVHIAPKLEQGAKEAILEYKVLDSKDKLSLLQVNLITGRSHQIRVQMSGQLNCPLFGDFKYGDKAHGGNLALWAYGLSFLHPVSKKLMTFKVMPDTANPAFKFFENSIEKLLN